jgi:hypothetical protein
MHALLVGKERAVDSEANNRGPAGEGVERTTGVAAAKATVRGCFAPAWLLLAFACLCGGAAPAAAQTVEPPNTDLKAGVVYGFAGGSAHIGGSCAAGGSKMSGRNQTMDQRKQAAGIASSTILLAAFAPTVARAF